MAARIYSDKTYVAQIYIYYIIYICRNKSHPNEKSMFNTQFSDLSRDICLDNILSCFDENVDTDLTSKLK